MKDLYLYYNNTINNNEECLCLKYPNVDYLYWRYNTIDYKTDVDISIILDCKLKELDCTREYECGRPMMLTFPMYNLKLSTYYYYLSKIKDQFIYNKYIDKLIDRHISNIEFEHYHPYIPKSNNKLKKKITKIAKYKRKDMFSNETILVDEKGNDIKLDNVSKKHKSKIEIINKDVNKIATFKFK